MNYTEKNLEEHIEKNLLKVGFLSLHHSSYDRNNCLVVDDLIQFIKETQPSVYQKLFDQYGSDTDKKLVSRIVSEISSRGVIDVLKKGVKDRGCHFSLVYFEPKVQGFTLEKFAPFVSGNNIHEIFKELSDAAYHIERNGNAKIILTDLSIKLTRLIHKAQ